MNTAFEELEEFEKQADLKLANLSIWKMPIRSILSTIYLSADGMFVGRRFDRRGRRDELVGTEMITRLSYVARLIAGCSREIGENIDDALGVADDQFVSDIRQLLAYAHFCEIMPLVRRGHFSVERNASTFFLKHPSDEFVKYEENDVLMSEMALPHDTVPPPFQIDSCKRIVKASPYIPGEELVGVLTGAYSHYIESVVELALLSDSAFQEAFGFHRAEFIRVRAGLLAYADFCLGMAGAAEVLSLRAFTRPKRKALQREVREWAAPLLKRNHIVGVTAALSGVDPDIVGCCRFRGHPVKVESETGGWLWERGGSSAGSSSLRP